MYLQRISQLQENLINKNLDAILISNFYNILYLTGFKTLTTDEREAFILVSKNNVYLFSDERYLEKDSKLSISSFASLRVKLIEPQKGLLTHLEEIVRDEKIQNLGFETEDLRHIEYENIKSRLQNVQLTTTNRLVVMLRAIKDEDEIEKIKRACGITDQCLEDISKTIKDNMSEKEIAFKIEMWIKEKGYDLAFDPIVAVDKNAAIPHYNTKTGNGVVKKSSLILIDFGVKSVDYVSDITRMIFFGKPDEKVLKVYKVLKAGQERTVESVSRFENLNQLDGFCRKLIIENNLPTYPHSTGHGVGLEVHEYPKVSFNSADLKKDGQVFTVEPGIYFPGKWGMRIEDTVVIKNGEAETLTKFNKDPLIIS